MSEDIKISQLEELNQVGENDTLIINDASDGNRTKRVRKKHLLSDTVKNVTDDGDNTIVKEDLIVNNDIEVGGDVRATGELSFGKLRDHVTQVTVNGIVDTPDEFLIQDSTIPTSGAIRGYVTNTMAEMGVTALNDKIEGLRYDIYSKDSDFINQVISQANAPLETRLDLDSAALSELTTKVGQVEADFNQDLFSTNADLNALTTRVTTNESGLSVASQQITQLEQTTTAQFNSNQGGLNALTTRVSTNESDISSLQSDLAAETSAKNSSVDTLQSNINAEQTARISADQQLTSDLSAEVVARTSGDNTLQSNIDIEEEARIAADSDIIASIQSVSSAGSISDSQLSSRLDSETSARIAGDSDLLSTISSETTGRISAIDTEEVARIGADAILQSNIDAEEAARIAADNDLSSKLDSETTSRINTDAQLAADIQANALAIQGEGIARDSDEVIVRSDLAALIAEGDSDTLASAKINDNLLIGDGTVNGTAGNTVTSRIATAKSEAITAANQGVTAEELARIAADNNLQSSITSEASRATNEEARIEARVNNIISNTDPAAIDSLTEIVAEFQRVDSDVQRLIGSNTTNISDEATLRRNADSDLQDAINAEEAARIAADDTLQSNIDAEESSRISADNILQSNINTEASTRLSSDTTLQQNIDTEESTRTSEVSALNQRIDDEISNRGTLLDSETNERITTLAEERAARIAADSDLQDAIDAEESARITAVSSAISDAALDATTKADAAEAAAIFHADTQDNTLIGDATVDGSTGNTINARIETALQEAIAYTDTHLDSESTERQFDISGLTARTTSLEARMDSAEADIIQNASDISTNATAISDEETRATGVENTLQNNIDSEHSRAVAAEGNLQTQITSIENLSANIDSDLRVDITQNEEGIADLRTDLTSEITRATNAENSNFNLISTETSRATGAEQSLQSQISDEVTRATDAEQALQDQIDSGLSRSINIESNLVAMIDSNATSIATEITRATTAEADLQSLVDSESTRVTAINSTLSDLIDSETTRALAAEQALQDLIDSGLSRSINIEANLLEKIDSNATSIASEISRALLSEQDLQDQIDDEVTRATGAEQTLTTNLNNEVTRATDAEQNLQSQIDSGLSRSINLESNLRTDINKNATDIANEVIRATGVEGTLNTAIQAEVTRATNAENDLATDITDAVNVEAAERQTADTTLQGNIDVVSGRVDTLINGSPEDLDTIQEVVDAFREADSDIQVLIVNNSTRLTNAETNIVRIDGELDHEEARIDTLETEMDNAEGRLDTLETSSNDYDTRIDTLETEMDTAEGRLDNLETNSTDYGSRIGTLETEMDTAEGQINTLQTELDSAETDIATLKLEMDTAESRLDSGDIRLDLLEAQSNTSALDVIDIQNQIGSDTLNTLDQTIIGAINEVHGQHDSVEARVTITEGDIVALETRAGDIEGAATILSGRVSTNENDITTVGTDISTINTTLGEHYTRMDGIDSRIDGVDDRIDGVDSSINAIETDIQEFTSGAQVLDATTPISVNNDTITLHLGDGSSSSVTVIDNYIAGLAFSDTTGQLVAYRNDGQQVSTIGFDNRYVQGNSSQALRSTNPITVDNDTITLHLANGNTASVTVDDSDVNNFVNGLDFDSDTGILTVGREGLSDVDVGLDGRYQLRGNYQPAGDYVTIDHVQALRSTNPITVVEDTITLHLANGDTSSVTINDNFLINSYFDPSLGILTFVRNNGQYFGITLDGRYQLAGNYVTEDSRQALPTGSALSTSNQNLTLTRADGHTETVTISIANLVGDASVDGTPGNTIHDRINDGLDSATLHLLGYADAGDSDTLDAANEYAREVVNAERGARQTEVDLLKGRATSLENRMDSAEADILVNAADIDAAELRLDSAESHIDTLETEMDDAEGRLDTLETEMDNAEGRLDTLETEMDDAEDRLDSIASGLLTETLNRINADAAIQYDLDIVEARVDAILDSAPGNLDTIREIIEAFQDADSDLQTLIENNSTRLTTNENDIDLLETEMDDAEGRLDTLETSSTDYGTRIGTLETEMDTAEGRLDTAESDIDLLETEMDDAEGRLDALENQDANFGPRITTLETEMDDAEVRLDTAESDIDTLETEMDNAEGRLDTLETSSTDYGTRIGTLETEMDTAESDIDTLETEMDNAEGRLDALENQDANFGPRITTLETEMDTAEADIDLLETEMDTAEGRLDTLEDSKTDHETRIGTLETEMDTAEADIDLLQTEMNAVELLASNNQTAISDLASSSQVLDATNALTVNNDTITLHKGDGTSESVSINDANTNSYVTDLDFDTTNGKLTADRNDGAAIETNLDGRYVNQNSVQALRANTPLTISGDTITLHRADGTSISVDIDDEFYPDDQTLSWNASSGELTISDGNTVDIDGRYTQTTSAQVLRATNAIAVNDDTITIYKGDGTSESVTISDANTNTYTTSFALSANGALTIGRNDGGTFTVDLESHFVDKAGAQALHPTDALRSSGDTIYLYKGNGTREAVTIADNNDYITGGSFANGTLSLTGLGAAGASISLDGRYQLIGNYVTTTSAQALHPTNALEVNNDTIKINKADGTSESHDIADALGTDYFITGLSFNTSNGVLTGARNDGNSVTASLDGRYDNYGNWKLTDGSSTESISSGETITISGGDNVTTTLSTSTNTLAISAENDFVTGASFSNGTLSLTGTGDAGASVSLDGRYVEQTSPQALRATNPLTVNNDTITLHLANGTTDTVTISDENTNFYINAATFSGGTLSLSGVGAAGASVNLDGRYVPNNGVQALHSTDALRISGDTIYLYKGNGTYESVTFDDEHYHYQNLSFSGGHSGTGVLSISNGNSVDLDGRYVHQTSSQALPAGAALAVINDTITLTRADGTSESVTISDANTNTYTTSFAFNDVNGVLSIGRNDGGNFSVDLDDRYVHSQSPQLLRTTNPLTVSGDTITLHMADGSTDAVTIDDDFFPNQDLSWNGANGHLSISNGNTVDLDGRYQPAGDYVTTSHVQALHPTDALQVNNDTITLKRADGTTESVTISDAIGTDYFVTGISFNTGNGVLTANRNDGQTLTTDFDGRYVEQTSPQALRASDALTVVNDTITIHKGDGTSESVTISDYFEYDDQTLSWNGSTGKLTISDGNTVDLDGRYLLQGTYDNYVAWVLSDGTNNETVTSSEVIKITGGTNVTTSLNTTDNQLTISATDTNNYLSSVSWNASTDEITFGRHGLSSLSVDLGLAERFDKYNRWKISDGTNDEYIYSNDTLKVVGSGDVSTTYNATNNTLSIGSTNTYVDGASFNSSNDVLTLSRHSMSNVTVDLGLAERFDKYSHWVISDGTNEENVISTQTLKIVGGGGASTSYSASANTLTVTSANDFITGASFNTGNGILSLNGTGGAGASVDLDGRYLLQGTYDNYVSWNLKNGSTTEAVSSGETIEFAGSGASSVSYSASSKKVTISSTDTNNYVNSASFSGGTLTLGGVGAAGASVSLDGRYQLAGNYDNYNHWKVKVGSNNTDNIYSGNALNFLSGGATSLGYNANTNTVTITSTDTNTDTNYYVDGASFNTGNGILTLSRAGLGNVTVDLDGRYATSNTDTTYDLYASTSTNISGAAITLDPSSGTSDQVWLQGGNNVTVSRVSSNQINIASTDTNNYVSSASYSAGSGKLTLHRAGLSSIDVTIGSNSNNYLDGASFNTGNGELTLSRSGMANVVVDLDGRYSTTDTNTTYSLATNSTLGLVKVGYSENGKNYPVELSNGQMYVNVPWSDTNTDTNTTYSEATSSTHGLVKIGYSENGKNYPVELSNGKMFVNVPWSDTNTDTNTNHHVTGASFNTGSGVLSLTGSGSAGASVDLDGRYYIRGDHVDLNDDKKVQFGTGDDYEISFNGSHLYIHQNQNTGNDIYISDVGDTNKFFFNVSTGDFHADGDIIAYSNSVSDEKMKENITVVENAVEKVQQLRGVEFTWKKDGEKSAGVIAQDVEKVLPQAVKEKDIMGEGEVVKTVNYDTMSALFIEAIKEQQEQIEALKAEIKALKE